MSEQTPLDQLADTARTAYEGDSSPHAWASCAEFEKEIWRKIVRSILLKLRNNINDEMSCSGAEAYGAEMRKRISADRRLGDLKFTARVFYCTTHSRDTDNVFRAMIDSILS